MAASPVDGTWVIEDLGLDLLDCQNLVADVIARIADHPVKRLDELLPWNWRERRAVAAIAA
jgi:hypothetical protein